MNEQEATLVDAFRAALGLPVSSTPTFTGSGTLPAAYAVSEIAAASVAAAGLAASELVSSSSSVREAGADVVVSRELACAWFGTAVKPRGWTLPSPWDAIAGDYRTLDGFIRLHTNAPRHRAAALGVLDVPADRAAVAAEVATWEGEDLELAVVDAGGAAAVMRSADEWAKHPQGSRVATEPLVGWSEGHPGAPSARWAPTGERPLAGLRVLDLTRVIAGPVATRFLAGLGADVLRIDPPDWDEPALAPEMTLGKRTARLDATTAPGRATLERLIAEADVLVHGYRPGALHGLVAAGRRAELHPGLIEISLDAYGWSGPWHERRGFDSLVQMSSGIAHWGMHWAGSEGPKPLPVQALDHATGYLMAAAALRALTLLRRDGVASSARVSLARTAAELLQTSPSSPEPAPGAKSESVAEFVGAPGPQVLDTPWGPADLLPPPLTIGATRLAWDRAPRPLGSDAPAW